MTIGVRKEGQKFRARIKHKGREKTKLFNTEEEASAQYQRWVNELHAPVAPVAHHHRILPFANQPIKAQSTKHAEAQARYRAKKLKENVSEFRANHVK